MNIFTTRSAVSDSIIDSWNTAAVHIPNKKPSMQTDSGKINYNIRCCEVRPITFTQHRKLYQDILNNIFPFVDYYERDFDVSVYRRLEISHLTYNEGDYIDDHIDISFSETKLPSRRKISAILLLSKRSDYEGGDLIIQDKVIDVDKGTLVMFEPTVVHRVSKVTKGIRKALLVWVDGPKWR